MVIPVLLVYLSWSGSTVYALVIYSYLCLLDLFMDTKSTLLNYFSILLTA